MDQERSNMTNMFTSFSVALASPVPHAASSSIVIELSSDASVLITGPVPPAALPPLLLPPVVLPPLLLPPVVLPPVLLPPVPVPPVAPAPVVEPKPKPGGSSTEGLHE